MANGLYYYKLQSPYPEDVTKNCKLTINEIDSNFLSLKGDDIKTAEFVRDEKMLVLTRNNGEKLFVDLSSATYDFGITKEDSDSGVTLTFEYDSSDGKKKVTLENVITEQSLKKYMLNDVKVVTDDTLKGFGNAKSPLGVKGVEKTGFYAPCDGIIDMTTGGKLPKVAKLGTRIVTKENVNDYGYLYNGIAVNKISKSLEDNGRGWRVPTKADWDALLNSVEPCGYRNHNSARCHVELGKYAGKFLKSACGWVGQEECLCDGTSPLTSNTQTSDECNGYFDETITEGDETMNGNGCGCHNSNSDPSMPMEKCVTPEGIDRYGFRILPGGYATLDTYHRPQVSDYKERAIFWTTTHVNGDTDQDVYVKEFSWNRATVTQAAECYMPYFSLRLVKDYDGSNYFGAEYIDGILYMTILRPESGQVWLASNYASRSGLIGGEANCNQTPEYVDVNAGEVLSNHKEYFLNEWNGNCWEKKLLKEGDTFVVKNPNTDDVTETTTEVTWTDSDGIEHTIKVDIPKISQHNIEFRVYTENSSCDKELRNTDDLVVERVLHVVVPMIEAERAERIAADNSLLERIDDEEEARKQADGEILESLREETEARINGDEQLWDALTKEISARTDVDTQLWEAILQEASARTDVDNQLWEGINGETARAQEVEAQLWEGVNGEVTRAQEVEAQLWTAINNETERAIAREDEIDGQLIKADEDYVIKVTEGLTLVQKNGNTIEIGFDGNYGEF